MFSKPSCVIFRIVVIALCWSYLFPFTVVGQESTWAFKEFKEPVNAEYWKRNLRPGIEIDSSSEVNPLVIFHRSADFPSAKFHYTADFRWAIFEFQADYEEVSFHDKALFRGATFSMGANFGASSFDSIADFWKVTFIDLGQAYEAAGRNPEAIEQYETFLDIWKNADEGLSSVEDAKERLAKLKESI